MAIIRKETKRFLGKDWLQVIKCIARGVFSVNVPPLISEASDPKAKQPAHHIPYDTQEALKWRAEIAATSTDILRSNVNTGDVGHPEYMKMAQEELARRDAAGEVTAPALQESLFNRYPEMADEIKRLTDLQLRNVIEGSDPFSNVYWSTASIEYMRRTQKPAPWP